MKNKIAFAFILLVCGLSLFTSCKKEPLDDKGLLITDRAECYMSLFDLLGSDNRTVLVSASTKIDTTALTVTAVAKYGTNLTRVKPFCSVVTDASVTPTMGVWTDFSQPRQYTVVSGNRQVHKTYTITVSLQP